MRIFEFEATVVGGEIHLPEDLKGKLPSKVRVTVTAEDEGSAIIPASNPNPGKLTLDHFSALKIQTSHWKFDREEANERR